MRTTILCLALQLASVVTGCATSGARPSPPVSGDPHGELRIDVYEARCEGMHINPRPNVPVYLVVNAERQLLGHTDIQGKISLRKDEIWIPGATVLLFCRDETFVECAALTVDSEYLRGFDEYSVELPTFRVF